MEMEKLMNLNVLGTLSVATDARRVKHDSSNVLEHYIREDIKSIHFVSTMKYLHFLSLVVLVYSNLFSTLAVR